MDLASLRAPIRLAALALAALGVTSVTPLPAHAQHWITPELCEVETPELHPELFAPLGVEAARLRAEEMPNATGKFWRIDGGAGAPSYLWGTIHSTDPRLLALPDPVLAAIEAAGIVAIEVDFTYESRRALEIDQTDGSRWRPFRTSFQFEETGIDPELIAILRSRSHGLGLGRDAPDHLTLGAVAELLLSDPCNDFTAGVWPIQDGRIQMLGAISGAEILGLEPPDRLRRYLDDPRHPERAEIAHAMIEIYASYLLEDGFQARGATGMALYLSGEMGLWNVLDGLHATRVLGPEGRETLARMDAYLLDQRNHDFIAGLAPHLPEGGVFVAVGAGHIAGKEGMVALLRAAGYTVTRIPLPGEAPG